MVIRSPTLDRPKAELLSFAQGDGLVTPPGVALPLNWVILNLCGAEGAFGP